ncbi:MAG: PLP-dependent aminotransferase family protein [Acidobacteria bacterium]|nr:PLP-dependent aminotransferase family protein [Acidobacteriota bacterium]
MRALTLEVPAGPEPRYRRIAAALRDALVRGLARPGERLPSTRELAETLGVHRNTVIAALDELESEGWIGGEQRKAYRVAAELPVAYFRPGGAAARARPREARPHAWRWARAPRLDPFAPPGRVRFNFQSGVPDFSLFPLRELRSHYGDALRRPRAAILDYGDPRGLPALVEALEDYLRRVRGLTGRRVIVTNGSQEGVFLAAQVLVGAGDVVAVEELTYPPACEAYRAAGARVLPLPMEDDGLDVDAFEKLARRHRIRLLFLTPLHQFPTTATLPVAKRLRLYEVASRHDIAIFEDDYDHEFHYRAAPLPPLASYDPDQRVIYASTLSKVLFPSARIGFLVVPAPLEERLVHFRRIATHHNDSVTQDAIARWFASGGLERHLRRMRRHYQARRDALVGALERTRAQTGWTWRVPDGGMALWLDTRADAAALARAATRAGIFVAHEGSYRVGPGPARHLRLGFSALAPEELAAGAAALARAAGGSRR